LLVNVGLPASAPSYNRGIYKIIITENNQIKGKISRRKNLKKRLPNSKIWKMIKEHREVGGIFLPHQLRMSFLGSCWLHTEMSSL